jgi:hypothetical protein
LQFTAAEIPELPGFQKGCFQRLKKHPIRHSAHGARCEFPPFDVFMFEQCKQRRVKPSVAHNAYPRKEIE